MNTRQRLQNVYGWVSVALIAFLWSLLLYPDWVGPFGPLLDKIGPFFWMIPIAMIVFASRAAKRGPKRWYVVFGISVATLIAFVLCDLG